MGSLSNVGKATVTLPAVELGSMAAIKRLDDRAKMNSIR